MSYSWAHGAPTMWDPLSTARWDQSGLGAVAAQVNYSSNAPLNIPQQFPPFAQPLPLLAQFPTRERARQMLSSSYPGLYPQSSGNFNAQAQGLITPIHATHKSVQSWGHFSAQAQDSLAPNNQSVTGSTKLHPAAWATHKSVIMSKYRCGYCGRNKESSSGAHNKRTRIRCECGGPNQDGKARMHSK